MKFAHLADCHIGSWREPKLRELAIESFLKAIEMCIAKNVDFILISGDLFNTALPGIDNLKSVVKELRKLRKNKIPVYVIAGSHDFSPSGKTMLDVLEAAGLMKNVVKGAVQEGKLHLKFIQDEKTEAKITGMLGKKGMLEKNFYDSLELEHLEKEKGFKIFMFHSAISEMKPEGMEKMDSCEISYLPKGFDYYAGGHVHIVKELNLHGYKNVVYPGPLFPNSFSELEKLHNGSFYIYEDGKLHKEEIALKNIFLIDVNAEHKSPEEVYQDIESKIHKKEFLNTIVLLKVHGKLKTGKTSDINFKEIFNKITSQGAFVILKNTHKLVSEEFEEIKVNEQNVDDVEDAIIKEHLQQIKVSGFDKDKEYEFTKQLMALLSSEKHEGEKVYEYEDRVKKEVDKLIDV